MGPVDLAGLEVVYATSSGSTVTRKGTWSVVTVLDPGKRVLLANAAGAYAALADTTYSGGFAATGGSIALRVVGGAVIDSVGWGDATNDLVEGSPAPAPAAGSSLERAPGGVLGNGWDTNDGAVDWFVQTVPSPQGLRGAARPGDRAGADSDADPDAHPHPDAATGRRTDADPDPDAGSDADAQADPDARPDTDPHTAPDSHPHTAPDPEPNADANAHAEPDTHAHADGRPDDGPRGRTIAAGRDRRHGPGDRGRGGRPPRDTRAHRGRRRDGWHRGTPAVRCHRAGARHAPPGHRRDRRAIWPARAPARPRRRDGRRRGCVPEPQALGATGPDESFEGRLVVATGRLTARPATSSSGDGTLTLQRTDGSPVKVFADRVELDRRIGVLGRRHVPGHRGRRPAGHADGCPGRLSPVSPRCGGRRASSRPPPTPSAVRHGIADRQAHGISVAHLPRPTAPISIAAAKRTTRPIGRHRGDLVTAPASLLDGSGKLFVVQDGVGRDRGPRAVGGHRARGRVARAHRRDGRHVVRRAAAGGDAHRTAGHGVGPRARCSSTARPDSRRNGGS